MNALEYAKELVSFDSVSRSSNVAITNFAEKSLRDLGFATERLEYDDSNGVRKACVVGKKGAGSGGLAYFGHTDVVPADRWFSDAHGPFQPTVKEYIAGQAEHHRVKPFREELIEMLRRAEIEFDERFFD